MHTNINGNPGWDNVQNLIFVNIRLSTWEKIEETSKYFTVDRDFDN